MKKIIALLLSGLILLSSCGSESDAEDGEKVSESPSDVSGSFAKEDDSENASGAEDTENIFSYSLKEEILTITGMGKMPDYTYDSKAPWYNERGEINKVIIKEGITSIGSEAFRDCTSLASITIPDSVTSIGDFAFSGCTSLTKMIVSSGNSKYHSTGNCIIETETKTLIAGCKNSVIPTDGSVTSIGDFAFRGCTSLTSITIPDSVTSIGDFAFRGCTSLTSITIPDSVTSIGDDAFRYCESLTSITIPDSVTSIGDYAFRDCTSLTSITIPDSVTSIGHYAFSGCNSLTSVTFSNPNGWYVNTSQGASSGTAVTLKNKTTAAEYLRNTYSEYYWYRK